MDLRPPLEPVLDAFALPAVVTLPDNSEIETEAFWLSPQTVEVPAGDFTRSEARRVLVLPASDVPQVPRETIVRVAECAGGDEAEWRVDGTEGIEYDHHRLVVVPHQGET